MQRCSASFLVIDFSPLHVGRVWRETICKRIPEGIVVHKVDICNVVPVWKASGKLEYGAHTIRTKIQKQLTEFLVQFLDVKGPNNKWCSEPLVDPDWDTLLNNVLKDGTCRQFFFLPA